MKYHLNKNCNVPVPIKYSRLTRYKFENPYDKSKITGNEQICRTTIEVFRSRHAHIMGTYGKAGALQTTINILIEKLYVELNKNGIGPSYDDERYADAINNCTISIGIQRSTAPESSTGPVDNSTKQTADRDDGRRTPRVAQSLKNTQQSASPSSTPKGKRGTKNKESLQ